MLAFRTVTYCTENEETPGLVLAGAGGFAGSALLVSRAAAEAAVADSVILRTPWGMLALLLGFLGIKALVIWTLARVTAMPYQERPVFTLLLAQGGEFAFVVFQAGAGFRAIPAEMASLLIGAVALSMLISPLLLVLLDRVLLKRFATLKTAPQAQEISEPQSAPVIIAGFGRYGQIPDGHPKLLHCWPVKLLQAGRGDYAGSEVMIRRAAASLSL